MTFYFEFVKNLLIFLQEYHDFDEYFLAESIREFHRVILMRDFMPNFADEMWPPEKRIGRFPEFSNQEALGNIK
jgi:glutaredoxin-related protein